MARGREAAGGVAPMHIGAVKGTGKKGKDIKGKGRRRVSCKLRRRGGAKKLVGEEQGQHMRQLPKEMSHQERLQKGQRDMKKAKDSGKPFVDRKQTAGITDDEIMCVVIEGILNMAGSSLDCVFAVMEKPSLGNHTVRWKRLFVLLIISVVQESM